MSPKEKAKELVDNMLKTLYNNGDLSFIHILYPKAKQCALVCVDEICEAINWHEFEVPNKELDYWNKVKTEIERIDGIRY